jgi:hypothetical protein
VFEFHKTFKEKEMASSKITEGQLRQIENRACARVEKAAGKLEPVEGLLSDLRLAVADYRKARQARAEFSKRSK